MVDSNTEIRDSSLGNNWNYEQVREYLLALGRGTEFTLSINDYPKSLTFSNDWHVIFNQIREGTALDEIERYALIGINNVDRTILLPNRSSKGFFPHSAVEGVAITEQENLAKKSSINKIIGDIHSHPLRGKAVFSPGDLYGLLHPSHSLNLKMLAVLVHGDQNLVAFRTHETQPTDLSFENFEKHWFERNGFRYKGSGSIKPGERAEPVRPFAQVWNTNTDIAKHHNLVIYRGKINKQLEKEVI